MTADNSGSGADESLAYTYVENADLTAEVVGRLLGGARTEILIATANLKDMRVLRRGNFASIVRVFSDLALKGVTVRLLHASGPSKAYRNSLRGSTLEKQKNFTRICCPRIHLKMVLSDRATLYAGSANFTGAGLGAKSDKKRNFEAGMIVTDPVMIRNYEALFEKIWRGDYCGACGLRRECPKPIR